MAELLKYHHRGEIKIPVLKDDDIEIYPHSSRECQE